ncbi:conserved hypothetical protein [Pseudomonas sp. 8Z]|uniref:hypothetical protein n=1 Tax=Pseudomonas sp. 8Z TaxID=2653166 RepID=UPI0012F3180E|nr:hypothetical protein [Pseudomonas sp. 8Z]VXC60440.1 conserved hypothetical protein [Pseudomonas sp. 8Z]
MALIPRHELWRRQYRENPYIRHLSALELEERFKDILNILTILTPDGKIGVGVGKNLNNEMWAKCTHVLTEMEDRYGPFPNGFTNGFIKDANMVHPTFPNPPKSKLAIELAGGIVSGRIYKFSKKKYIDEMFSFGKFRVAPASYYSDPSLNVAIRDDELVFNGSIFSGLKGIVKPGEAVPSYGRIEYSVKARTNYYVTCFASNYTYREFSDFDADSCLVIKKPRAFTDRLIRVGNQAFSGYEGFAGSVKYLDPILCDPRRIDVNFAKHFKYAYQNEYRIIWAPREPVSELQPIYLEIGPLDDIAEIIEI